MATKLRPQVFRELISIFLVLKLIYAFFPHISSCHYGRGKESFLSQSPLRSLGRASPFSAFQISLALKLKKFNL